MCCSVLQYVAVCCSMLQCAAHVRGCCSRCAAVCYAYCSVLQHTAACCIVSHCVAGCCRMLQCADSNKKLNSVGCQGHVAACCSVLQCVAVCEVCCSVLQCVAVCCSVFCLDIKMKSRKKVVCTVIWKNDSTGNKTLKKSSVRSFRK